MTGRTRWGQQQLGHPWQVVWGLCVWICVCICVCVCSCTSAVPTPRAVPALPFPGVWLCNCWQGSAEMHFPYLVLHLFSRYCIRLS